MRRRDRGRGPAEAQPPGLPGLPPPPPLPAASSRRRLRQGGRSRAGRGRWGGGGAARGRASGAGGGAGGSGVDPGAGGRPGTALNWPEGPLGAEVASWGQRRPRGCRSKRSPCGECVRRGVRRPCHPRRPPRLTGSASSSPGLRVSPRSHPRCSPVGSRGAAGSPRPSP